MLLLGLSVSLASCNFLSDPLIPLIRAALNFGSSILLFRIIGYVTLQKSKKLYGALQAVMILAAVLGMASKIVSLFPLEQGWLYAFADQSENGSVILSASLCILLMAASYRKSNEYSKKQMKILLLGLGLGAFLFLAISILPDLMIVQNIYSDEAVYIEVTMDLGYTVARSVPLLLFTGISAAIIFLLLRRAFSVDDPRLKIWPFVFYPLYTGAICFLLFLYGNAPVWIIAIIALLLVLPPLYQFWRMFSSPAEVAEQTYERRLLGEVEKEKQELSIYLHDDVLQSLIAFYRKIRSDRSGQYREMETALSELIAGVRRVRFFGTYAELAKQNKTYRIVVDRPFTRQTLEKLETLHCEITSAEDGRLLLSHGEETLDPALRCLLSDGFSIREILREDRPLEALFA